jgi:hypothetical protein
VSKFPYRASLPLIFGLIAVALMAWGVQTDRLCIGYDAGRPFWPCETPNFTLGTLNAPAIALSRPLANVWRDAPSYFAYFVELPLIVLWWWFLGTRLDFGLPSAQVRTGAAMRGWER